MGEQLVKDVQGLDGTIVSWLIAGGYETVGSVRSASDGALLALRGIGDEELTQIRAKI